MSTSNVARTGGEMERRTSIPQITFSFFCRHVVLGMICSEYSSTHTHAPLMQGKYQWIKTESDVYRESNQV